MSVKASQKAWTPETLAAFVENYPKKGKNWCVANLGLTEGQVRSRAGRLKLKAAGVSDAWHANNAAHSARLTGRKRPDQAEVMRLMHAQGKLPFSDERRQGISVRAKQRIAEHGHPRGALGMHHSEDTKRVLGEKSRAYQTGMSDDQRAAITRKTIETKLARGNLIRPRPNASWKAGWREIGGKRNYYRSRWEANYARYLEWLKLAGEIVDWAHEPDVFWFDGIKRGCVSYLPDFKVTERNGAIAYHEVKGWMDDRSKTKIRRMAKYHPGVMLIVIAAKQYRQIERQVSALLDGWESKRTDVMIPGEASCVVVINERRVGA